MNLFDKLGEVAKKAGSGVEATFESHRVKAQIESEGQLATHIKAELGKAVYEEFLKGNKPDGEALLLCEDLHDVMQSIDALKAYKETLTFWQTPVCTSCGAELEEEFDFCPACGTKRERKEDPQPEPAPAAPKETVCPACGEAPQKDGQLFCHKCGSPF